ncbi:hypothetical protein C8R43DRAFT_944225 [Mycena crocata]|nr:hypothetical protein C8R43DRAFT_944225 [Mycena crocata]
MSDNNDSNAGSIQPPPRADPVKNVGQFVRHIQYWMPDGSIVVRVKNTMYNIHLSHLTRLSVAMNAVLTIPNPKPPNDPEREGTELYPLFLEGVEVQEFNDFLFFLYRTEWEPVIEDKERICMSVLKLADLWIIKAARTFAINILQTMGLPASRRLELAGKYKIVDWVDEAVRDILKEPLSNVTDADLCRMGWKTYSILAKAKELLWAGTCRTALVAPAMVKDPDWECRNHASCQAIWPKLWFDKIGKRLLNPMVPFSLSQIHVEAAKPETFTHQALSEQCRVDMVFIVCHKTTFPDEQIIPACVDSIVKMYESW